MLSPGNFTVKKRRIVRFEGLTEFKWSDLGEQDVVGQGSFGAVLSLRQSMLKSKTWTGIQASQLL